MDKGKPHDKSIDSDEDDRNFEETSGFKTMEVEAEEDFETVSNVKYDRAFNYQFPNDPIGNPT